MRDLALLAALIAYFGAALWILHMAAGMIYRLFVKSIVPIPTHRLVVEAVAKHLAAEFPDGRFAFVDIGSGEGIIAAALAKKFPAAGIVGIEHNPYCVLVARVRAFLRRAKNVRFNRADMWSADVAALKPDVVYIYLGRRSTTKMGQKLLSELPGKCRIISNHFKISGAEPEKIIELDGSGLNTGLGPILVYRPR